MQKMDVMPILSDVRKLTTLLFTFGASVKLSFYIDRTLNFSVAAATESGSAAV